MVLTVDGRERHAIIHVPQTGGPLPVVLLLHGSGGSGAWAIRETRWDSLADQEGVLVAAPDATRPEPKLQARFYTNPAVWNDGSNLPPVNRVRLVDDVAFIRALLEELPRRWPIDQTRIAVTGFSNGAGMTFRLGLELAEQLAAIAPVAGHLAVSSPRPTRPVPTLFMTGSDDPLIPIAGGKVNTPWATALEKPAVGDTLARWADLQGLPPQPADLIELPGLIRERWPGDLLEAWQIDGLGHHWPGGRGELNRRIAGQPSNAVDATRVIWDFFRARRR